MKRVDNYAEAKRETERLSNLLREMTQDRDNYKSESERRATKILEQADQLAATKKDLDELREINANFKREIEELRKDLEKERTKSNTLQTRLDTQQALLHAYNLTRLYIYYYVEPGLHGKLWRDVAPDLSYHVARYEDNQITRQELDQWINQNFPQVSIPVEDLQRLNQTRNGVTHINLASATRQQQFLQQLKSYKWPDNFKFEGDVKTMVNILLNSTTLSVLMLGS